MRISYIAPVALLCLCAGIAASAGAGQDEALFMNKILDNAHGRTMVAGPSSDWYDEEDDMERVSVRFRTSYCGGSTESYWTSYLYCDNSDHHAGGFTPDIQAPTPVGVCYITTGDDDGATLFGDPNIVISSNYLLVCTILPAAKTCGLDIHGELSISSTGFAYEVYNTYMLFDPETIYPPNNEVCFDAASTRRREAKKAKEGKKKGPAAPTPAVGGKQNKPGAKTQYYNEEAPPTGQVWNGDLIVYTGPMTVTSRKGKAPYQNGWVEWLWPETTWSQVDASTITDPKHVDHPYTITMQFWKHKEEYGVPYKN